MNKDRRASFEAWLRFSPLRMEDGEYADPDICEDWRVWQAALESQEVQELLDVIEEIINCPQCVDEATVPSGGIEVNPGQVVMNLSVSLARIRKARAAIAAMKEHK